MRDLITPLIITYNEGPNIRRTLDKLAWARRVVVIDSGSTDDTTLILDQYPNVEKFAQPFVDFASQCNFGLTKILSDWVLSLDADYELSDELIDELQTLSPSDDTAGYRASFVYRIYGDPIRGTLYPARTVLYRRRNACYIQIGHSHRVDLPGQVRPLRGIIFHDDRKPLSRWVQSQLYYARDEADHLLKARKENLGLADRIRLLGWPAPIAVFFYVLFVKRCFLDGWSGWFYALQRTTAEMLISIELIERRMRGQARSSSPSDAVVTKLE